MRDKKISVSAIYHAGFGLELDQVHLKNETGSMTITGSQWEEVRAVMTGKRKGGYSEEFDGYNPKTVVYWN